PASAPCHARRAAGTSLLSDCVDVTDMATVLLIEDHPGIRAALQKAFTSAGHVVSAVGTGLEALREVAALRPDLVVLDVNLPDLDGAVVLRMIRGESRVPIIAATGSAGEDQVIRLLNAGADDCVVKPFSSAYLLARTAAVLRRRHAGAAAPALIEGGSLPVDPPRPGAPPD